MLLVVSYVNKCDFCDFCLVFVLLLLLLNYLVTVSLMEGLIFLLFAFVLSSLLTNMGMT